MGEADQKAKRRRNGKKRTNGVGKSRKVECNSGLSTVKKETNIAKI